MGTTIRPAAEGDIDALLALYGSLYDTLRGFGLPFELSPHELRQILAVMVKSKLCRLLIAEENGETLGFISAAVTRMDRKLRFEGGNLIGTVNDICVSPACRGTGLAARLLSEAEDWFRASGAAVAECDILCGNLPAQGFWRKQGYTELALVSYKVL
ncbi:MAG: GNAT family N-acetyltransferase [Oscillospiraceae bacterium]